MIIDQINISNYLHAKDVSIKPATPVTLIAGHNGSGKSSIRDAIHHALTGEASRVKLKKQYDALVTDQSESGFAEIITGENEAFSIVIPSGKGNHSDNPVLPYVLDAQRFASLDENERRRYLFGVTGIKLDPGSVCEKLIDKGCDAEKVERIKPILRAGFDAAMKEAENKAKESKGGWKAVTGGETWGKDKGLKWQPAIPETAIDKATELLGNIRGKVQKIESELSEKREILGSAKQIEKQLAAQASELEALERQAASIDRVNQKIERDSAEAKEIESKIKSLEDAQSKKIPDPFLVEVYSVATDIVDQCVMAAIVLPGDLTARYEACKEEYKSQYKSSDDDKKTLATDIAKLESSLKLMRNSVSNGKRDLAIAEEAKKKLDSMEVKDQKDSCNDIEVIEAEIKALTESLNNWKVDEIKYQSIVDHHQKRESIIKQATKLHQEVIDWLAIAEQLSPTGIPSELLAGAINPINTRLLSSAQDSWMLRPEIHDDMTITATKENSTTKIPYDLLSESEQWRVDAMIAEAISYITGVGIMVLDRFDVLDMLNRGDLIGWLDQLAADKDINTCIIFGTLKEPPKRLPDTFTAYWIEDGIATEAKAEKVAA